jgi:hypothetical protein
MHKAFTEGINEDSRIWFALSSVSTIALSSGNNESNGLAKPAVFLISCCSLD